MTKTKPNTNVDIIAEETAVLAAPKHLDLEKMEPQDVRNCFDIAYKTLQKSFMALAYMLNIIKENKYYKDPAFGSYKNIYDFAENEYHIKKTQVTNYINVWIKFHDPDRPAMVQEEYNKYSMTQLIVYNNLDDEGKKAVNPSMSVSQMKEFIVHKQKSKGSTDITPADASFQHQLEQADKSDIVWKDTYRSLAVLIDVLDNERFIADNKLDFDVNCLEFDIQARYVGPKAKPIAV